jgi:hypothetical protein
MVEFWADLVSQNISQKLIPHINSVVVAMK